MLRHASRCAVPRGGSTSARFITRQISRPLLTNRTYASVTDISSYPSPGEQIHGFTLKQVKHVPELHLTALQLEHDKTGAEYLHLAREDKNNVFAINFKTNPVDRTGLPHILEHVTLCGSEKYPVRDPFFKMMPRSLANFMNAFTSSDYTSYPFATTNLQDYKNLSSVYLDATLHPLLKHSDFLQEGWRLGPEDPREVATEDNVKFKGVVYNEMKGQMSDASYLFYIRFREHILPSLENSGGDPEKMTNLTHEDLVKFSRQHYHPSNAKIFSYGGLDVSKQLEHVNSVLSTFERIETDRDIKIPIELQNGTTKIVEDGPLDSMQSADKQVKSSVSWLGCETSDIIEDFSLTVMMSLLTNGYGSPLYQALIESGIGTNFSPNTGYDSTGKVGIISIGLDGLKAEDAESLKDVIQNTLREKASDAFQQHKIDGYMHQLELSMKHKIGTFGMGLLEGILPGWFNGVDILKGLAFNDVFDAFRQCLAKPGYLESLVEKYLLTDKCFHFTMQPRESYNDLLQTKEELRREEILEKERKSAGSTEAALSKLGQQELELLEEQESAQTRDLDTLPTLRVSDIPLRKEKKPLRSDKVGNADWLLRETSTNGITYFQAKHVFDNLPTELRLLLPLFTGCLMRLGTKTKSVGDLEAEIQLKTGGMSVAPFSNPDAFSLEKYSEGLMFGGCALDRNVPAMFELLKELVLNVDFDSPRAAAAVTELLELKVSGALDSVAETGHHFAVASAAAALTERGRVQEQLSGLPQIEATVEMLQRARADPGSLHGIIDKLKLIQQIAVSNSSSLSMRTVCEPSSSSTNRQLIEKFLNELPSTTQRLVSSTSSDLVPTSSLSRRTFFNLPFQVSYTGTCLYTAPYASADKAPLKVLGQLLTHNFMHPEVREKGGAYGASAAASPISALFTMSSYRDPNPRNTLKTFERAGNFAREKQWSSRELEESKLSIFQDIDAPTAVAGEGSEQFMYGITEEMGQQMRERLLDVSKDDVHRVAQKYMVDLPQDKQSVCVLGQKKDWLDTLEEPFTVRSLKMSA